MNLFWDNDSEGLKPQTNIGFNTLSDSYKRGISETYITLTKA